MIIGRKLVSCEISLTSWLTQPDRISGHLAENYWFPSSLYLPSGEIDITTEWFAITLIKWSAKFRFQDVNLILQRRIQMGRRWMCDAALVISVGSSLQVSIVAVSKFRKVATPKRGDAISRGTDNF